MRTAMPLLLRITVGSLIVGLSLIADFNSVRPAPSAMETGGTLAGGPLMPAARKRLFDLAQCLTI